MTGSATWVAPAGVDAEVANALRGLARGGHLPADRGRAAIAMLSRMPLERVLVGPLLQRVWELRDRFSAYDASYVALTERLGGVLVTADERMARTARGLVTVISG